jgi:aspartyl-tRNA(Asn)/glutamyl-tRNA(Gln) amidotransferase subunit C
MRRTAGAPVEVTTRLVRHVARLARLAISDEEATELKAHFEKILAFIAAFQDLDTRDVDPSMFASEACNVFREDETRGSLSVEEVLANAPAALRPYFVVPRIVGDADSGDLSEGEGE